MCHYTLTKTDGGFGWRTIHFLEANLMKLLGMALMFVAFASFANAVIPAPEVDPGSAGSALALLSGALLVIRSRRKK